MDGALVTPFGLICSSILLSMGLPPAAVGATVHAAEVVTAAVSGASHAYFRNIDKRLFSRLTIAGAVGGAIGAYVPTRLPGDAIRPFVHLYLLALAILILVRSFGRWVPREQVKRVPVLGFFVGLLDASGGGGRGPLATSTLLARGGQARTTIGTVSASECVVTLVVSLTLILTLGLDHLEIVLGLLVGGAIAAPFVRQVPERPCRTWSACWSCASALIRSVARGVSDASIRLPVKHAGRHRRPARSIAASQRDWPVWSRCCATC